MLPKLERQLQEDDHVYDRLIELPDLKFKYLSNRKTAFLLGDINIKLFVVGSKIFKNTLYPDGFHLLIIRPTRIIVQLSLIIYLPII